MNQLTLFDSPADLRKKIVGLQDALQKEIAEGRLEEKIQTCTWKHYFSPGVYAREMTIPAGLVVVGKIHKFPCINTISKGRIYVLTENGRQEIVAPYTFVSEPGIKRAVVTAEETVWTTYHSNPSNESNLDRLEKTLVADTYEDFGLLEVDERGLIE